MMDAARLIIGMRFLFVFGNGKTSQGFITFFDVGVAAQTKITAVNAGSNDVVVDSGIGEIGVEQLLLFVFTELGKHLC